MSYEPTHPGTEITIQWLYEELRRIAYGADSPAAIQLQLSPIEPDRPQLGMVVYTDGVSWNPGSGEGLYAYLSAGWMKIQTDGQVGLASQIVSNDLYLMSDFGNTSYVFGVALGNARITIWPVYIDADASFDGLQVHINAASTLATTDFNLYEFLGCGKPGAAIVSVNVPVTSTGVITVPFTSVLIESGWYFASFHQDTGTPSFRGMDTSGVAGSLRQSSILVTDPFNLVASAAEMSSRTVFDADLPGGSYSLGGSLAGLVMTTANSAAHTRIPNVMFIKA